MKGCIAGLTLGGVIKQIFRIIGKIIKGIAMVLGYTGLWIPFLYAIGGVILYFTVEFNPFDGSTNAILYIVGFALCCACSLIILIRKLIVKPIQKYMSKESEKNKDKKGDEKETDKEKPKDTPPEKKGWFFKKKKEPENNEIDGIPLIEGRKSTSGEVPKVYYSTCEPNTLIHEYSDRFEVYRIVDNKKYLDKIEYKHYEV